MLSWLRWSAAAAVVASATAGASGPARSASATDPLARLTLGTATTHALSAGETQIYEIELRRGDFVHVTIEQQGIDVVATLVRPDRTTQLSIDACNDDYREEAVVAIADADGAYTIAIRPVASTTPSGRYSIRLDEARAATGAEAARVEAERAFERARTLQAGRRPADYPEALKQFDAALQTYRQTGDRRGELKVLVNAAFVQFLLGQPEMLVSSQRALDLARSMNDRASEAAALLRLALAQRREGDLASALQSAQRSTAISEAIGNRKAQAESLNAEGALYGMTDDPEKAALKMEQALPLARATGFRTAEANLLNNLGIVYRELGDLDKSLDVYTRALQAQRAEHNVEGQITALNNLGNLHHTLNDDRRALELHTEALALARSSGGRENLARSLNTVGNAYYDLGDYDRALAAHREALEIRREIGDLPGQAASLTGEGRTLHRVGDSTQALAKLDEALGIWRRLHDQVDERNTLRELAVVKRDTQDVAGAVDDIRTLIDLDERIRSRITSPQLRGTFVATEKDRYELYVDLLQQRHASDARGGHDAEALGASERARARVLLDSLFEAHVDLKSGIAPGLLERERALQRQVNEASARLSRAAGASATGAAAQDAQRRVDQLARDYAQLEAEIRRQSPSYAALTQPEPLAASMIQERVLDDDTVLLEFSLGETRSWLWAATKTSLTSVGLPPRRTIEAAARSLYKSLTARQARSGAAAHGFSARVLTADARFAKESAALSTMLLGGIAEPLGRDWHHKRLAIVAGGPLEYLPFAALPAPAAAAARAPRVNTPLVIDHEIVMMPSASVVDVLRREAAARTPAPHAVAILADPVFTAKDPRVGSGPTNTHRPVAATGSSRSTRAGLERLPFSREEANAIASLARPGDVLKATDFDASRSTVLNGSLADYRVVHFATHGVVDSSRPWLSGLVFSLVDRRGGARDGYIRLRDIYNLRLNADLVVLSACDTALGADVRGEGLVGLARGFMYAGSRRVMASLWQVNDVATADLMKRFYRGLLVKGLTPPAALRAAQLEMMTKTRWTAPYFWAGFVLQGDWQ